jgi:hypothetical protein
LVASAPWNQILVHLPLPLFPARSAENKPRRCLPTDRRDAPLRRH